MHTYWKLGIGVLLFFFTYQYVIPLARCLAYGTDSVICVYYMCVCGCTIFAVFSASCFYIWYQRNVSMQTFVQRNMNKFRCIFWKVVEKTRIQRILGLLRWILGIFISITGIASLITLVAASVSLLVLGFYFSYFDLVRGLQCMSAGIAVAHISGSYYLRSVKYYEVISHNLVCVACYFGVVTFYCMLSSALRGIAFCSVILATYIWYIKQKYEKFKVKKTKVCAPSSVHDLRGRELNALIALLNHSDENVPNIDKIPSALRLYERITLLTKQEAERETTADEAWLQWLIEEVIPVNTLAMATVALLLSGLYFSYFDEVRAIIHMSAGFTTSHLTGKYLPRMKYNKRISRSFGSVTYYFLTVTFYCVLFPDLRGIAIYSTCLAIYVRNIKEDYEKLQVFTTVSTSVSHHDLRGWELEMLNKLLSYRYEDDSSIDEIPSVLRLYNRIRLPTERS